MSQKSHPKILKITGGKSEWLSRGFYGTKYPQYLEEDFRIREFLKKKFPKGVVEEIEIERGGGASLKVIIKTSRPALIIGRGGEGVERLQKEILKILNEVSLANNFFNKNQEKVSEKRDVKIEVVTVKNPWACASLASQWIASQLEKRVPYRRALKMALQKIMSQKEVKGARVQVSGRLNGIEIARTEWLQEGELPRQRINAIIDYGFSEAFCTYGVIGVKVWIYKGDDNS